MFDLPLHPIIVHFAIALGVGVPFIGFGLWYAIRKNWVEQKFWRLAVLSSLLYALIAVAAVQLGEVDEEKVEKVVAENIIEHHEEAAEAIPWVAGVLTLLALAGCRGKHMRKMQLAFSVAGLLAIIPLANAGHTGGELVYEYGASIAHVSAEKMAQLKAGDLPLGKGEGHSHDGDGDHGHDDDD